MTIMGEWAERLMLGQALAWDSSHPGEQARYERARAMISMLGIGAFAVKRRALAAWVLRGGDADALREAHGTELMACVTAAESYDEYTALDSSVGAAQRRAEAAHSEYAVDDWMDEWRSHPSTARWRVR
jgi:hypothetical protein